MPYAPAGACSLTKYVEVAESHEPVNDIAVCLPLEPPPSNQIALPPPASPVRKLHALRFSTVSPVAL